MRTRTRSGTSASSRCAEPDAGADSGGPRPGLASGSDSDSAPARPAADATPTRLHGGRTTRWRGRPRPPQAPDSRPDAHPDRPGLRVRVRRPRGLSPPTCTRARGCLEEARGGRSPAELERARPVCSPGEAQREQGCCASSLCLGSKGLYFCWKPCKRHRRADAAQPTPRALCGNRAQPRCSGSLPASFSPRSTVFPGPACWRPTPRRCGRGAPSSGLDHSCPVCFAFASDAGQSYAFYPQKLLRLRFCNFFLILKAFVFFRKLLRLSFCNF